MASDVIPSVLVITGSYLLGAMPSAYLLARVVKGIDIRKYGSGNVGISNFSVHVGRWWAVPLVLFDIWVKGILPVTVASDKVLGLGLWVEAAAGMASILGHNWSFWLKFTGGRGMATVLGVVAALYYPLVVLYGSTAGMAWLAIRGRTNAAFAGLAAGILAGFGIALWVLDRPLWVVVICPVFLAALLSAYALTASWERTARRVRDSALWWGVAALLLPAWSLVLDQPVQVTSLCLMFLAITAAKRLISNRGTGTGPRERVPMLRLVWNRLVFDRDIDERRTWVHRSPEEPRATPGEGSAGEVAGHGMGPGDAAPPAQSKMAAR
jgi:glycerol-3-phosphate acyltransferase PlsY